jgi:hypothetical protein
MALLEAVQTGEEGLGDLRTELTRVRRALDRTDAVLEFADDTLQRAEVVIVNGRKWVPVAIGVVAVAAVGATVFLVMRKRRRPQDDQD